MAQGIEERLKSLGVELPAARPPAFNYVPTVESRGMLYVSGQVPMGPNGPEFIGKLGRDMDVETGKAAARLCAVNVLVQVKAALGSFDRVRRFVKVVGFVNSAPDFNDQPKVVNGASDFFVEVFGEAGRHARSAVGMGALPLGVSVEVEAILELE